MIPIFNSKDHFGMVAIILHWVMAILIIGLLAFGLYMTRIPISAQKLKLFGWHKEFGMLVLMLIIVRLTWRLQNTTPSLANLPWWEEIAARIVHLAFYFLMFALPITGWLVTSAADLPVSFFGWFVFPNLISPDEGQRLLFTEVHKWLAYLLIVIFCMHVGAALKHYFINKDAIMQRMLWP